MTIKIDNSKISNKPWSEVDKSKLSERLEDDGSASVIHEAYLDVPDVKHLSSAKEPHHDLEGDTLVVSKAGVHAAAARFDQAELSDKSAAAKHLIKHYREMGEDPPEVLTKAAKGLTSLESVELVIQTKGLPYQLGPDGLIQSTKSFSTGLAGVYPDTRKKDQKPPTENLQASDVLYRAGMGGAMVMDPTKDQVKAINDMTGTTNFKGDGDVYTIPIYSTSKALDADFQHLTDRGLDEYIGVAKGGPMITDHQWGAKNIIGRTYSAKREGDKVLEEVYVPASKGEAVDNFRTGLWNNVSIGFGSRPEKYLCDMCNQQKSIFDQTCPHKAGQMYADGRRATVSVDGVDRRYEMSVVMQGKNPEAMVARKGLDGPDQPSVSHPTEPASTIPPDTATIEGSVMADQPPVTNPEPQAAQAVDAGQATPPATAEPVAQRTPEPASAQAIVDQVKAILPEKVAVDTEALKVSGDELVSNLKACGSELVESVKGLAPQLTAFGELVTTLKADLAEVQSLKAELAAVKTELGTALTEIKAAKGLIDQASGISTESMKQILREEAEQQSVLAAQASPVARKRAWVVNAFGGGR